MNNPSTLDDNSALSNQLADFVDQALSGGDCKVSISGHEDEFLRLQQAALNFKAAVEYSRPSQDVQKRIWRRLKTAWPQEPRPFSQKTELWRVFSARFWAVGLAVAALLVAVFLSPQVSGEPLVGTAQGNPAAPVFLLMIGIVILGIVLLWRRRH